MGATSRMIQTGEPAFNLVFGAAWEEHLATEPHARTRFNRLVAARKELLADHLADHRWTGQETVIDLGGGNGALLQDLLARRTGLRGIVFDLPEVVAEATERLRAAGLTNRCQTVAGSFVSGRPHGGDVYLRSHILHGWDDDHARQILQAVRRAIPDHGRLLVVEEVLAPPNQPGGKIMDLLMATIGGRERTKQEWRALLADGGFALAGSRPAHSATILDAVPTSPALRPCGEVVSSQQFRRVARMPRQIPVPLGRTHRRSAPAPNLAGDHVKAAALSALRFWPNSDPRPGRVPKSCLNGGLPADGPMGPTYLDGPIVSD